MADQGLAHDSTISAALLNSDYRLMLLERLGRDRGAPLPVIIELFGHPERNDAARARLNHSRERLFGLLADATRGRLRDGDTEVIAGRYVRCDLYPSELARLAHVDRDEPDPRIWAIESIWPDFPVDPLIHRAPDTIKTEDARSLNASATGKDIVWAVIDSGIDEQHPHFDTYDTLRGSVGTLHHDFTGSSGGALADDFGHGTHVAGIIAGALVALGAPAAATPPSVLQHQLVDPLDPSKGALVKDIGATVSSQRLTGVAPECKLVSLKVLNSAGKDLSSNVLKALDHVKTVINKDTLVVRGINLSLGYEFSPEWFGCGASPLCKLVDDVVASGVIVVAAAGNTGSGVTIVNQQSVKAALPMSVNDPGNARKAITVGATHPDDPQTYGVSYFSSKGPTADGRAKPDLVAPGERVISCATGNLLAALWQTFSGAFGVPPSGPAYYGEHTGTSMAAPHVSGAIAALLSCHTKYIGKPDDVKALFLAQADTLERDESFEGKGIVNLLKAVQNG